MFYDRAGYDGVTDLAYYIAPEWQGRERAFTLAKLLDECRNRHMRKACGIIFADNRGSIALMKHFGFTHLTHAPSRHRLHRNHARHELLASRPVST